MDEDTYRSIAAPAEGIFKSRGSRFLSFAFPMEDTEAIKNQLQILKAQYHDARHYCYAYRLGYKGESFRSSDDREPSGTAGKPILGQIHSFDLTNVLIVVVRYFGGTLLGTSGLTEAYKLAAYAALSKSEIIEKIINSSFHLKFEYPQMNDLLRLIREEKAVVTSREFMESGSMSVDVRKSKAKIFTEKIHKMKGISIIE